MSLFCRDFPSSPCEYKGSPVTRHCRDWFRGFILFCLLPNPRPTARPRVTQSPVQFEHLWQGLTRVLSAISLYRLCQTLRFRRRSKRTYRNNNQINHQMLTLKNTKKNKFFKNLVQLLIFFYLIEVWDGAQRAHMTHRREKDRTCQNAGMIQALCHCSLQISFDLKYSCNYKQKKIIRHNY